MCFSNRHLWRLGRNARMEGLIMNEYTFIQQPKAAGCWVMPGSVPSGEIRFFMPARPNWLHRTFMNLLLGWKWRDEK